MPKEKLSWEEQKGGKVEVGKVRKRVICPISEENAQCASQENELKTNKQKKNPRCTYTKKYMCMCLYLCNISPCVTPQERAMTSSMR